MKQENISLTKCINKYIIKEVKITTLAEKIVKYIRSEADKEVARKTKARDKDIRGCISQSIYRNQRILGRFIGSSQR